MLKTIEGDTLSNPIMDDLLTGLCEQVQVLVNPSTFYIALHNEQQDRLDFVLVMEQGQRRHWPSRMLSPTEPLKHIIRSQQMLLLERDQEMPAHRNGLGILDKDIQFFWGLPLVLKDKSIGVMVVADHQANSAFHDEGTKRLLPLIANQVAHAVRNATLFATSSELADGLSLINRSMQKALFTSDSDKAIRIVCETAMTIVGAQKAAVFLIEKGRNRLRLSQEMGLPDAFYHWFSIQPFYLEMHPPLPYVVDNIQSAEIDPYFRDMAEKGAFSAFAEIPLRSSNELSGLLVVYHDAPYHYRKSELDLLETLANHVAANLDNLHLFDALEVYAFEMAQLVHLSQISTASLNLDEVGRNVSEILRQMTGMHRVTLLMLDVLPLQLRLLANSEKENKRLQPLDKQPLSLENLPELQALVAKPASQPRAFEEGDKRLSPGMNALLKKRGETVMAVVPLVMKNTLMGMVFLGTTEDRFFSDREWQFIETAANHIAAQIYNASLHNETQEALRRRLDQLSQIEHIARQISGSLSFSEVISNVLEAALQTLQADSASLALATKANEFWVIGQRIHEGKREKEFGAQPMRDGIISQVALIGQAMIVPDNAANAHYVTRYPGAYHSSVAVPLSQDGMIIGVLNVESSHPDFFTEEHASFLKNLAEHAVISIENARHLEERQYQIDTLTALRRLSIELASVVEASAAVQLILQTALDVLHGQYAMVFRCDDETGKLSFLGELQSADDYNISGSVDLLTFAMKASQSGELQTAESSEQGDGVIQYTAFVAIPLKHSSRVRAVLCMVFNGRLDLQDRDVNAIDLLAGQAAGHLENAWLNDQIRANSEQVRAILDSTKDGIVLLDREGRLVQSNPSAHYLLGMQLEEHLNENFISLLEQRVDAGEIGGEGYTPEEIRAMWRMLRLEPQRITRRHLERHRHGQTLYIEEIGSPVLNTEGNIIGRLLVLRDVTQEKQLKAFQDKITNSVVHDLRSPLGAIISSLKIAQDNLHTPDSTATIEKTLTWASESAKRLIELVNTMLEIARMETMQLPLNRNPVSIRQLAESAYMTLVTTAEESRIQVDFEIATNIPPVFVDGEKIQRVLINLLHNALRFTPAGGRILITASHQVYARKVVVRVADSGTGIPLNERENIFEKFRQVEGSTPLRGGKGSGLGLTFCKLVLEAHEERIWVEDKSPLSGACFAFTLPIATDLSVID